MQATKLTEVIRVRVFIPDHRAVRTIFTVNNSFFSVNSVDNAELSSGAAIRLRTGFTDHLEIGLYALQRAPAFLGRFRRHHGRQKQNQASHCGKGFCENRIVA